MSSRCTMPARGSVASDGSRCSRALTRVPVGLPAPGCTTSPAGLSMTMTSLVLVQDVERDVLGQRFGLGIEHHVERDLLAATHRIARPDRLAVEQGIAGLDPFGQPRARELREQFGQDRVETAAGGRIRDDGSAGFGAFGAGCGHVSGSAVVRGLLREAGRGSAALLLSCASCPRRPKSADFMPMTPRSLPAFRAADAPAGRARHLRLRPA